MIIRAWGKPTAGLPISRSEITTVQLAEPSLTIPYSNPYLPQGDPQQPIAAWNDASFEDIFVPVDMLSRFTAKLQVGGITYLPYQQNLQVAPSGAVTTWKPR